MLPVVAAVVLSAAACGGDDPEPASAPAPATASAPAASAGEEAYLTALGKIDAGLVANRDRAIRRAKETCADIEGGEFKGEALNKRVAERLSGGDATIDAKQAGKAVELMKAHIC